MAVQPLFFLEAAILQGPSTKRQRTAVRAFQLSLMMEKFEVLANRYKRGMEAV
jgi:hypothetical protein